MKRIIFILFLLSLLIALPVLADETCYIPERYDTDSLTWDFDDSTGTLFIHGTGPMRSYVSDYPEWETYIDQITTVCFDEGITSVGEYAFYYYVNLQKIVLPDSLKVIDNYAFYNTLIQDPVDIVFPEGLEYIGKGAFHSALKTNGKYVIPSSVFHIGSCAFSNAAVSDIIVSEDNQYYMSDDHALLTKDGKELLMYSPFCSETVYSIPDGVVKIDMQAFNITMNLEKLYIPATVTEIEDGAIFSTFNLNEITVSADNQSYKIIDGALCSIDGKSLIAFPDGIKQDKINIPDGVERIGSYVFYGRFDEDIVMILPETLKIIGKCSMPSDIASITIPKGIEVIEEYAFCYEGGVVEVFYGGSESDWQSVDIGDGNIGLVNAVIHFME